MATVFAKEYPDFQCTSHDGRNTVLMVQRTGFDSATCGRIAEMPSAVVSRSQLRGLDSTKTDIPADNKALIASRSR